MSLVIEDVKPGQTRGEETRFPLKHVSDFFLVSEWLRSATSDRCVGFPDSWFRSVGDGNTLSVPYVIFSLCKQLQVFIDPVWYEYDQ